MIRLINIKTLQLESVNLEQAPAYATASHRWLANEPTYRSFSTATTKSRDSSTFAKVQGYCSFLRNKSQAIKAAFGNVQHLWIDTCCIDQDLPAEVSNTINLMFRIYARSTVCVAWLYDISDDRVQASDWFDRGWTLQELLVSKAVLFLNNKWQVKGHKLDVTDGLPVDKHAKQIVGPCLHETLQTRTGIPRSILLDRTKINTSVENILQWINRRQTSKVEDRAYCLLGMLDVEMTTNYGEGSYAMIRLLMTVRQKYNSKLRSTAQQQSKQLSTAEVRFLQSQVKVLEVSIANLDRQYMQDRFGTPQQRIDTVGGAVPRASSHYLAAR